MTHKKQNRKILSILILIFITSGCALLSNLQKSKNAETQELTFTAVTGKIDRSIDFIGNVKFNQSAQLTWKTDGVIGKVLVKLGDSVKKGDVLAELETDSMKSAVILAEKTLIDAQEALSDVIETKTSKMNAYSTLTVNEISLKSTKQAQEALYYPRADQLTIEMAYDAYMLAVENFNYAKADYDSVKNSKGWEDQARQTYYESYLSTYNAMIEAYENWVWTKGQPTDTELAVAQGAVAVAQQAYDEALKEYQTYESMPRQKDIQEAEINVTNAENVYNKRNIIASFDGTVTSSQAEVGHYVEAGTVAFGIDDMTSIFIPLQISEIDIHKLFVGQKVNISLDAVPDKTYSGIISKISDLGEESDSIVTFETLVEITDPDANIKAGMTAETEIILEEKENVVLIPTNAVSQKDGKSYVTVSSENGWNSVEVSTGIRSNLLIEITSGISEGDVVKVPSIDSRIYTELGIQPAVAGQFQGMPGSASFNPVGGEQTQIIGDDDQSVAGKVNADTNVSMDGKNLQPGNQTGIPSGQVSDRQFGGLEGTKMPMGPNSNGVMAPGQGNRPSADGFPPSEMLPTMSLTVSSADQKFVEESVSTPAPTD
jgi:HlyD family secretion protein